MARRRKTRPRRGASATEQARRSSEARRQIAERSRVEAEERRSAAEGRRRNAEEVRHLAETARTSAEQARGFAEEARRHRDAILLMTERLRHEAEGHRARAEQARSTAAARFDTDTRRAIREEVEISTEMQTSADNLRARGRPGRGARPGRRGTGPT